MNEDFKDCFVDIGKRVRAIRNALNLKQAEMAEKLDVVPSFLSSIETGRGNPSFLFLLKLNRVLNVNMAYVFNGIEPMFMTGNAAGEEEKKFEIGRLKEIESMDQLIWLSRQSVAFRNSLLGWASIYFNQHADYFKEILET